MGLFKKSKTNWQKAQATALDDQARFRDVHEQQQMDRKHMEEQQTMTSRIVLAAAAGIATLLFMWWLAAMIEMTGACDGINRGWNRFFYSNDGKKSDYQYVTVRNESPVIGDDGMQVLNEDGTPAVSYDYDKYIIYKPSGMLTDIGHSRVPVYTGTGPLDYDYYGNLVGSEEAARSWQEHANDGNGSNGDGPGQAGDGTGGQNGDGTGGQNGDGNGGQNGDGTGGQNGNGNNQGGNGGQNGNNQGSGPSGENSGFFTEDWAGDQNKKRSGGDVVDNYDAGDPDPAEPTTEEQPEDDAEPEERPDPYIYYVLVANGFDQDEERFLGKVYDYGYVFRHGSVKAYIDYDGVPNSGDEIELHDWRDPVELSRYGFEMGNNKYQHVRLNRGRVQDTAGNLIKDRFLDMRPTPMKLVLGLIAGLTVFAILYAVLAKNLKAANLMSDTSDINQHYDDQRIALPEEIQKAYDIFPDVGAHSSVMVSSMISHQALTNRGLKKVRLAKRADKDILDEDGDVEVYKGDILRDEHGEPITVEVPLIDNDFTEGLFDSSKTPKGKNAKGRPFRRYFDASGIPYNPGNENLDKLKGFDTVAELINKDWEFPIYEPQRPGGMYIVDTAPVNTMVLAITRAGKGQTIIEPTIDMWTRESRPNNMVINDPKGELLVKNYVRGTVRGFTIVQFNLINPMKTDIYNPLALAAEAARDGNSTKCAMYVENIAEVFFPVDGGEDPLWPNAANNAFKRAAYGLIDFYLEEEKNLRRIAAVKNMDKKVLEQQIDEMWGKVTLYNCYQLFVQMSSKKQKDPGHAVQEKVDEMTKEGRPPSTEEQDRMASDALDKLDIWAGAKEADMLTLFFNATAALPKNSMRTLVTNADNALKAMGGAEKMIASVYGIAITAMSFFTDPTISTLTSGTIAQNVDLAGLSFPRRFGVRFHMDYLKAQHLVGMQCLWDAYEDENFEKPLGKDFTHEDTVSREGWARYFFKGCFQNDKAYIRLRIKDVSADMLVKTFYFEFQKDYQTSYDGRTYMRDPVLGTRIVKNGFLTEMVKIRRRDGTMAFRPAPSTFDREAVLNLLETAQALEPIDDLESKKAKREEIMKRGTVKTNIFTSLSAKYQEKCKMVFLVTPPHLMKYAKLILILIKQLVDLNFDQSYMTKSSQKPLYKTRYMLDELGNLQSEGHGISGFETMLSIGLGQEQQFTLILQTLQQLKDVYGDSVDKIVQGNTSNIVFLKSTDDSMIETLSKMSGVTHKTFRDSKTVTQDVTAMTKMTANEGKVSYTMSTVEKPVISYNDMAAIPPCNSIVFRAGDMPIWNRNETALPMSWRLFKNTIINPGKEYTLQTIPSLSTAKDFDVKQNQPNFTQMFDKRLDQAGKAKRAMQYYMDVYGLTEDDVQKLDIDVYSDEIMEIINQMLHPDLDMTVREEKVDAEEIIKAQEPEKPSIYSERAEKDDSVETAMQTDSRIKKYADGDKKIYANKTISRNDLVPPTGVNHALDGAILTAYTKLRNAFSKSPGEFKVLDNGGLASATGTAYIIPNDQSSAAGRMRDASDDPSSRVSGMDADTEEKVRYDWTVTDAFYKFLVSYDQDWPFCRCEFSRHMANYVTNMSRND